ncbi:MAG: hypothetical protein WC236_14895 [Gallionellaceae bacterium]|jgi:hypothetical protein
MRALLALLLTLYSQTVTPEQAFTEWWQPGLFGAPCSTKIDRIELPSCRLDVKRKPIWK